MATGELLHITRYCTFLIPLQTSPDPHLTVIDRWQGYLRESMVRKGTYYNDDKLERRWQAKLKRDALFHRPPQVPDEEVIRCWEGFLTDWQEEDPDN